MAWVGGADDKLHAVSWTAREVRATSTFGAWPWRIAGIGRTRVALSVTMSRMLQN